MWVKIREKNTYKGSEAGARVAGLRYSKEASTAGAEQVTQRIRGQEQGERGGRSPRALQAFMSSLDLILHEKGHCWSGGLTLRATAAAVWRAGHLRATVRVAE